MVKDVNRQVPFPHHMGCNKFAIPWKDDARTITRTNIGRHKYDYNTSGFSFNRGHPQGCKERAPAYDRDNTFFDEDFKQLKEVSYLLSAVPKELGGL